MKKEKMYCQRGEEYHPFANGRKEICMDCPNCFRYGLCSGAFGRNKKAEAKMKGE